VPDTLHILLSAIFVNNVVMAQFLGLCPFMGSSQRLSATIGLGTATLFVLTLTSAITYLIEHWLIVPLGLEHLRIIAFIVTIAGLVRLATVIMRATQPVMHQVLGIFMPLITTNCAVLGVALINLREHESLIDAIIHGFGAALGFFLVLALFAAIRERQEHADIPRPFRGAAVNMVTAGLMSAAFLGFTGIGN
jgi:electron transport complex protein RnfA